MYSMRKERTRIGRGHTEDPVLNTKEIYLPQRDKDLPLDREETQSSLANGSL